MDDSAPRGEGLGSPPDVGSRSLRDLRAERLLTIRDLARAAGVAAMTIHEIEMGTRIPGPRVMRRVSGALGVMQDDVTEFRSPRQPPSGAGEHEVVARLEAMGYPHVLALRIARQLPVHLATPPTDRQ